MDHVTPDLVDDLVIGAGMLAAGGGAQPWPAAEPLRRALHEHGPATLVAAAELDPDAFVLTVGVFGDRFPDLFPAGGGGIERVVRAAEQRCGRPCAAVVPLQTGGLNALVAPLAAAVLGLPCVDGDGIGRGFARLDLTGFGICGIGAAPAVVSDGDGTLVTVESPDNRAVDRLVQAAVADMGGAAVVAAYPMAAGDCARAGGGGPLRYCAELGRAARALRGGGEPGRLLPPLGVQPLFTGQVVHVSRTAAPAGRRGTATVQSGGSGGSSAGEPARTMRIDFQDGNLVASEDGVVRATVPDLIAVLDADSWVPVHTDQLEPRHLVHVVAIQADQRWRSADGIAAAGPRQFGYDIDYEPLCRSSRTYAR